MRYLVKFTKTGSMRFIGHLDLLRTIQRTLKRAKLPVAYSNGFNPHQLVSFAAPLPVGMTGLGEVVEIAFAVEKSCGEICDCLNSNLPDGIRVLGVREMGALEKGPASLLSAALFEITSAFPGIEEIIAGAVVASEMIVEKTGKNSVDKVDIKEGVYELRASGDGLEMLIAQGSRKNIKPELVVKYLWERAGEVFQPGEVTIMRRELYREQSAETGRRFIPLFDEGEPV